jgi:hypothetical protein
MQRFPGSLSIYNKFENKQIMAMKTRKSEEYTFNVRGL